MNGLDSDSNQNQPGSDLTESNSIVKTNLSPGRVVRRKKQTRNQHQQRASFPQARLHVSESKAAQNLGKKLQEINFSNEDDNLESFTDKLEGMLLHYV